MNDLFIDELEFEKTAYARISENPADWTKDVIETFFSQFPYFAQSPVEIVWRQRDDAKGYAIGAIEIKEGIGMSVPILVKARELFPFDIAIVNGNIMPLTNATIQMYLQSKGAFLKAVPKEVGDITYSMFNPSFASEISPNYAGANSYTQKVAEHDICSVFDKIASTLLQEDKDTFFTYMTDDKLVNKYKDQTTGSFIVKIAKTPANEQVNITEAVRNKLPRDIHYIYKSGAYEYKGIFGNSKIYDPITLPLDAVSATKFEAIKDMNTGIKVASSINIEDAAQFQVFHVENSDRNIVVFLDKSYSELPTTDKISLTKVANAPSYEFQSDDIKPGISGFYKLANNTITKPFKVDRVWTEKSKKYIEGFDGLRKVAYCVFKGIDVPYTENDVTYIPTDLQFIKLGVIVKLNELDGLNALHSNHVTKLDSNAYRLFGQEFDLYKTAFQLKDELDEPATTWHVLQCGGSKNDVEKIASLKSGESYRILTELHIPVSIEKLASLVSNEYGAYALKIKKLALALIKDASAIPSLPTIDAVLSLNFANKNNLTDFIEAVPLFESTVHYLAKLLLQTRLGIAIVEESALRKVMLGLVDILQYLQGIATIVTKSK
mgnify:CR=1 FL=1